MGTSSTAAKHFRNASYVAGHRIKKNKQDKARQQGGAPTPPEPSRRNKGSTAPGAIASPQVSG